MDDVGLRIKMRRLELGMTQTELAKKMGYTSKAAISKVEVNDEDMSMTRVKKFANALDCSAAYLLGWERKDGSPVSEQRQISKETKILMAYKELDPSVQKVVDKILGLE